MYSFAQAVANETLFLTDQKSGKSNIFNAVFLICQKYNKLILLNCV